MLGSERHLPQPGRRFCSKSMEGCSAVLYQVLTEPEDLVLQAGLNAGLWGQLGSPGPAAAAAGCSPPSGSGFPRGELQPHSHGSSSETAAGTPGACREATQEEAGGGHLSPYLVGVRLCVHLQGQKMETL